MNKDNKKIAQNTIFLYSRMLLTMAISLLTSRIILQTLGEVDFGIYNVVGGIVILFSFLNATLATTTQRFISYELGTGNEQKVHQIFSISMSSYFIILGIIILLCETIGLWLLNTQMNIPESRMYAANWVYQFSILAFAANILRIPYSASIIAYEKMNFYAYSSIVEVILKLIIVYALYIFKFDKLILYSFLMFLAIASITFFYKYYSNKHISTTHYFRYWNKELFKKIAYFSGWSTFGSFASLTAQQGLSILLNIFFGVIVNAAIGIANQITNAVYQFVTNFQLAFNPQIIKSYAAGEKKRFQELIFCSSKMSYFLLLFVGIPIIANIDFILHLWLGDVPIYTSEFVLIILVYMGIDAISSPLWLSAQAKGNIKRYQITLSCILLLNIPLAYIASKLELSPITVWGTRLLINLLCFGYRCFYSHKYVGINIFSFFKNVMTKIFMVTFIAFPLPIIITKLLYGWTGLIISGSTSCITFLFIVYFLGFNKQERIFANTLIKNKIKWKSKQ